MFAQLTKRPSGLQRLLRLKWLQPLLPGLPGPEEQLLGSTDEYYEDV